MTFIGVDPGMSGGVVWLEDGIPPTVCKFGDLTEGDISEVFSKLPVQSFAILESVHSFPGQGVASSFKFGMNFGMLKGFLYGFGIPFELVTPQKWQKEIGCLTGGDKNISKTKAQQLFPQIKVTHAIADALLLAEYARRTWKQRYALEGK